MKQTIKFAKRRADRSVIPYRQFSVRFERVDELLTYAYPTCRAGAVSTSLERR